ncbi:E3 ubiquitin-protein ligase TM129-like [Culicoides brevitarsis]|uniref:E3 ubiquitin-protein ligase TM129-like n=1 Tax=Culicoides brevitarsis TaxID=469753 RepID=UPI00307BECB7
MSESDWIYFLFALVTSFCFIFNEFASLGLSIENLFAWFIGDEYTQFVQHHILRTSVTLVVHSALPMFFIVLRCLSIGFDDGIFIQILSAISVVLPSMAVTLILYYWNTGWITHSVVKALKIYQESSWMSLVTDINTEFRGPDKMVIRLNSISNLVVTENWLFKTTPYTVYVAHQSDMELIADKTDTHEITEEGTDIIQYVNIRVKPHRGNAKEFSIRIKAPQFKNLQDRLRRQVIILPNVRLQPSLMDRFIDAFKDQVAANPKISYNREDLDVCFACFAQEPDVKIRKNCLDLDEDGNELDEESRCGNCYCRPMFCVSCCARWFSARQDERSPETWLEKKSPCPMCRTKFCMLDICYIEKLPSRRLAESQS